MTNPLCSLGAHEQQMYVQPSVRLREEVHGSMEAAAAHDSAVGMPRVRWRPYIATGKEPKIQLDVLGLVKFTVYPPGTSDTIAS